MHPTEVRTRRFRRPLALWMASSLALAGCGEAVTETPGPAEVQSQEAAAVADRRIIVYSTTSAQLYMEDASGTTRLVAQRTGKPVVSPDGKKVAYAKLPDTWNVGDPVVRAELHVLDLSGRATRLTSGHDDTEPVWTPDGKNLLFQSTARTGVGSLWKVKVAGSGLDQVTNEESDKTDPTYIPNPVSSTEVQWAPTERRIIVYSTTSLTNGEVRVIGFDHLLNVEWAYSLGEGYSARWTDAGTVAFSQQLSDGQVKTVEVSVE
jgi:TolB protein